MNRKRAKATDYLSEPVNYGGEMSTRGAIVKDMREQGHSQKVIDRYLQGLDAGIAARLAR